MKPGTLRILRAVATGAVVAAAGVAAYLAERFPAWGPVLVPITTAIGGVVGKAIGVPIQAVLEQALEALKPAAKEAITRRVLESMPPLAAARVVASVAPPSIVFESDSLAAPPLAAEKE